MATFSLKRPWLICVLAICAVLAACSDGAAPILTAGGLGSPTGYWHANAIVKSGFSETELSPDSLRVRVEGTGSTPRARIELIARARAAELGVERKGKFFKPGPAAYSVVCEDGKVLAHKSGKSLPVAAPVVEVDVVYAKSQVDPSYLPSAETFATLTRALNAQTFDAESRQASAAEVKAACGK